MSMKPVLTGLVAVAVALSARAEDTVITAPEGVVVTNTTALYPATQYGGKLIKRGKGTYYADCLIGATENNDFLHYTDIVVEEGTLIIHCGTYGSGGHGACRTQAITVRSGATLRCEPKPSDHNSLEQFYRIEPVAVTIEENALFDANNGNVTWSTITFAGAGTLKNTLSTHYTARFSDFTGTFLNDTSVSQSNPTFGDSTAAFDFLRTKGIVVSNNVVRNEAVRIYFRNPGTQVIDKFPLATSFNVTTDSTGRASMASPYFYNDTTINDFTAERIRPLLAEATTKLTINGGRASFVVPANQSDVDLPAGSKLTINGGHFVRCAHDSDRNRYYTTDLKDGNTQIGNITVSHVNFLYNKFIATHVDAEFVLNGGHLACNGFPYHTYLRGGKIDWNAPSGSGDASSNVWDGVKCYCWTSGSSAFTYGLDSTAHPFVFCVGKKGGWFETHGRESPNLIVGTVWKSACPASETDGGMKFFGYGYLNYSALPEFRGPLEVNLSYLKIPSVTDYDTDHLYGYGNLVLGNTQLQSGGLGSTVRLAGGPSAKLVAKGAPQIAFNNAGGVAAKVSSYVAGPSGASASSLAREKGGAFILYGGSTSFAIGTESSLKVEGGVEKNAAGLPKVPVFQANTKNFAASGANLDFVDYDDETGFVPFANYQTAFGNRATDVVNLNNVRTNLAADTVVGAMVLNNNNAFASDTKANITIPAGVTLTVGDGTNPAAVLMNSTGKNGSGQYVLAAIRGDGTLAFGNSEALFAVNGNGAQLDCNITGNNDFSFVGTGYYPSMRLSRSQNWTGTVRANKCRLIPATNGALGSGKIVLGSGWGLGGTLELSTADLVFANDITMGGSGVNSSSTKVNGALVALTNATLTGDIDFYGTAWIGIGNQGCLTLTGEMKGNDNLEIVNPINNTFTVTKLANKVYSVSETLARDTNGRVIIEGANNAYTGDVSVIRTTLVLRGAKAALGWGDVELDAATLRFENTTPLTVHGRITGSGVLELAGRGLVTFADLYGQSPTPMPVVTPASGYTVTVATAKDESKFTLKLARARTAVNSLKGVGEITTDLSRPLHLSVLDDEPGSYTGTLPANVTLHYGEIYRTGCAILVK